VEENCIIKCIKYGDIGVRKECWNEYHYKGQRVEKKENELDRMREIMEDYNVED
jgi:hypothetical protein